MILKLKAIKQIIKEELEKVVNEDLYADEEEYEQAIKDFMKLHNISREEAKKAIDAAGDEMDAPKFKEFSTSIEEEKENIEAFRTFLNLARGGRRINGDWAYEERQDLRDLAMDFKNNLQNYFKKNKYYKIIFKGYEFCKTYMYDKHGLWDQAADAYGKLNKPLLQRDIGAAITMAKLEPQLQADVEERTEKCEENLVFALSYVDRQTERDKHDAYWEAKRQEQKAAAKKRKEEEERIKNELLKKGIPEKYIKTAIKTELSLSDTLNWDVDKWEEWYERYQRSINWGQMPDPNEWRGWLGDDNPYLRESKFTLTQKEIKQIIKEELEKVINEDLYADEEEYEQAIKDFMERHNVSREVAKKTLDAAGDEMDEYEDFKTSVEKEKQDIHNYKEFLRYASRGEGLTIDKDEERVDDDISELIYDFKSNYEEKYKNIRMFKKIHDGYQYCLNKTSTMDVREPGGEKQFDQALLDFRTELSKAQAPLMSRDLTALGRMRKHEEELEQLLKKRNTECEKKLGFALLYAYKEQEKNQKIIKARQKELEKKQADSRAAQERFEKYGVKKGEVLEALKDVVENYNTGEYWIKSLFQMVDYLMIDYGSDLDVKTPGYDGLEKRLRRAIFDVRANGNYDALSRMHTMIEKLYEKETAEL